ncbi:MAG: hypothetical protein AAB431_02085 [Patescibacteria group bacterium]
MAQERENIPNNPSIQDSSALTNAQIFTMPEAYRYGKDVKLVEPKVVQKPFVASPTPLPPHPPAASTTSSLQQPLKKKSLSHTTKALFISGGIVFVALAVGGFLVWKSGTKPPVPTVQQTPTPQPTPRPVDTVPTTPSAEPGAPTQPTQSPFATTLTPGKDSDSDGLTDVEEQLIYKTNPNLPDTDSDGFLDGNEVFHRYNPSGTAPGTLLEAKLVQLHTSLESIQILYPFLWTTETITPVDVSAASQTAVSTMTFRAPTGESISMSTYGVLDADVSQAFLLEWIQKHGGQEQVVKTKTKDGNELYITRDQLKAFVSLGDRPVLFEFQTGLVGTIEYTQTFQMMINSMKLK